MYLRLLVTIRTHLCIDGQIDPKEPPLCCRILLKKFTYITNGIVKIT